MNDMEKDLMNHPILQQMQPSSEQNDPIFSRGQDLVVTAGAGTGKTRTLVARYLSLLSEGIPLRSIVAITFTKKAAREMRNRIREIVIGSRIGGEGSCKVGQHSIQVDVIDSLDKPVTRECHFEHHHLTAWHYYPHHLA